MGIWGAPTAKGSIAWGTAPSSQFLVDGSSDPSLGFVCGTKTMVEVPLPKAIQSYAGQVVGQLQKAQDCDQENTTQWNIPSVRALASMKHVSSIYTEYGSTCDPGQGAQDWQQLPCTLRDMVVESTNSTK